jgi:ABC-type histidine transport system ATPase subunit
MIARASSASKCPNRDLAIGGRTSVIVTHELGFAREID